jgi:hypothetical protein
MAVRFVSLFEKFGSLAERFGFALKIITFAKNPVGV